METATTTTTNLVRLEAIESVATITITTKTTITTTATITATTTRLENAATSSQHPTRLVPRAQATSQRVTVLLSISFFLKLNATSKLLLRPATRARRRLR